MESFISEHLPDGLLDLPAGRLHEKLDGPKLFHLPGRVKQPLVVSVLQHGNEISGWDAVRHLLGNTYARQTLPRSLILMIGNVEAAAKNRRFLPGQPDFNRCWPGHDGTPGPLHRLFAHMTAHVEMQQPLACIDIHNNTGNNPHYSALNHLESGHLALAARFSPTALYFTHPRGTQSRAFGAFCPAITLECGPPHLSAGADHAQAYLHSALEDGEKFLDPAAGNPLSLFEMAATVFANPQYTLGFGNAEADIVLRPDLEQFNFKSISPGTVLGHVKPAVLQPLRVSAHRPGHSSDCFRVVDGKIIVSRTVMPVMLTTDARVVHQDCLCHLLQAVAGIETANVTDPARVEPQAQKQ